MVNIFRRWIEVGLDTWKLGLEASTVITLRTPQAAMGGDLDRREARLMIHEKIAAALELQTAFFSGSLGTDPTSAAKKVIRTYTETVRVNRLRLT